MRRILILFVLLIRYLSGAQTMCTGYVIDSISNSPIEFANVGIVGKNLGTVTDEQGKFTLRIPDSLQQEPVKISMVGYKVRSVSVSALQSGKKVSMAQQ